MNPAIGLCALRSIHVVINYSKFIISLQIYFKYIKKIKKRHLAVLKSPIHIRG